MGESHISNKVIELSKVLELKRGLRHRMEIDHIAKVYAFTSGKGGVGKTNIVANLGVALSRLGKRVLILDADLGLGNLDILMGLAPRYNLSHAIRGEKTVSEISVEGPENIKILPAASGIQDLTQLTREQRFFIISEIDRVLEDVDILLIDTAAGISSNVTSFNVASQEIFIVVTPEPSAITDAYALMKVLCLKYGEKRFNILVNASESMYEANEIFRQLCLVVDKFLNIPIEYFGCVLRDANMIKAVKSQKLILQTRPDSPASKCFMALAKKIIVSGSRHFPKNDGGSIWKHFCMS